MKTKEATEIVTKSIAAIVKQQTEFGSWEACESYRDYKFCWLRDGTFAASALVVACLLPEALSFFRWARGVLLSNFEKALTAQGKRRRGERVTETDFINARFHVDGSEEPPGTWGNAQLDGPGIFLWGLSEFLNASPPNSRDRLIEEFRSVVELATGYLVCMWDLPCNDIWEEHGDARHTSTLAAIFGGLSAANAIFPDSRIPVTCHKIESLIRTQGVSSDGTTFKKCIGGDDSIDASLMWLVVPFGVVKASDPIFAKTFSEIQKQLVKSGRLGVHRYRTDTYFGGGEWILLTCWSALVHEASGDHGRAKEEFAWVQSQMSASGEMAEQVVDDQAVFSIQDRDRWISQKGLPASDLIWSHAMHVIVARVLGVPLLH